MAVRWLVSNLSVTLLGFVLSSPAICAGGADGKAESAPAANARVEIVPRLKLGASLNSDAPHNADLRIDVPLVLINVNVTTPLGLKVTNLTAENFRLFEDNAEQKITHFSSEDAPVSVGLLLDSSGSMRTKLPKAREAAAEFFKTANPEDDFFLIEFSERAKLAVPSTHDAEDIQHRLRHTRAIGRTALLDAIGLGIREMKKSGNKRKALLILSDGGDNHSRLSEPEVKNLVRESDVQVYAIGIYELDDSEKLPREELNGPRLLQDLAEDSGGRAFTVENLNDLPEVCAKIGLELRNQYVLGYSPTNPERDGKYRHVRLKLAPPADAPPLRTYYRTGYYAPSQ